MALISSLLSQSIPACPKLCMPKPRPSNFTLADPYPACAAKCAAGAALDWNPEYQNMASTVALMVGVIMIALAPVLGWFMNFVPSPVIMGFTTGGGLIIAMGQLKDVMGYPIRKDRLHEGIHDFFAGLGQTHGVTCAMGVSAAAFLFVIRKLTQGRILWWKAAVPPWAKQVAQLRERERGRERESARESERARERERQTDRQTDGQTDRQTDRQTETVRLTDRQTNR